MQHKRRRSPRKLYSRRIPILAYWTIAVVLLPRTPVVSSFVVSLSSAKSRQFAASSLSQLVPSSNDPERSTSSLCASTVEATSHNNSKKQQQQDAAHQIEQKISSLGKAGKTDEALETYNSLWTQIDSSPNKVRPNTRHMNVAIDACARARPPRLSQALDIFHNGIQRGLVPNVFTFGSLLSVCARSRNCEKAIEMLNYMQDQYNVQPNGVVYSTAIAACERAVPPQPHTALELLRNAQVNGVVIGVVGYNTILSAFARTGEVNEAIVILREMEQGQITPTTNDGEDEEQQQQQRRNPLIPFPDQISYATIMTAYERLQQWENVLNYAEKMKQRGFRLDGMAYSSLLNSCQQLGLADEAIRYLNEMKQLSSLEEGQMSSASVVLNGGSTTSNSRRSTHGRERSGAKQELTGPDHVAYGMAISACSRAGRWKDGLTLLDEMRQSITSLNNINSNSSCNSNNGCVMAYTAAINGCAQAGQWKVAFQLLDDMIHKDHGVTPNVLTFSAVISSCAEAAACANEIEDKELPMKAALELLEEMKHRGVEPNIVTYNSAIKVCAEGLNLARAFQLFEEARENALEPTMVTFGSLMTACERVGSVDAAGKVFRYMKEYGMKANEIIYGAAISCCRKKREVRALLVSQFLLVQNFAFDA